MHGGSFTTALPSAELLDLAGDDERVAVVERGDDYIVVCWSFPKGGTSDQLVTVRVVSSGASNTVRIELTKEGIVEGILVADGLGPVNQLMQRVDATDPTWRPL